MNDMDVEAAIRRIMVGVDYYLHCELDEEYDHERPDNARARLEAMLRSELSRARAVGLVSALTGEAGGRREPV